ncbi:MAG TPA: translation initiation factor IF-2 subunit alpha, partial [Candidatus Nanoarchaeia archaeon]|nr:translation initiation factor IF-2 subunit alpha [Candidatus Nanoarchaeia archaeon]
MIHISEVAPGRIRNIREFVQEGKKVVCKVLQTNKEKGHIDLSLRRVNETQKRNKLNQIKQEQLAEKIIEHAAKQQGESAPALYNKIAEKLIPQFGTVFAAFEQVSQDALDLEKVLDKKIAKLLSETVKARIKPPQVKVAGNLKLLSYSSQGINEIRESLMKITSAGIEVHYLGAGTYHLELVAEEYKEAERKLKDALDQTLAFAKKKDMQAEWVRAESS